MPKPPALKRAYYSASIADFLKQEPQTILGHLAEHHSHDLEPPQRMAWVFEIELLQRELIPLSAGWIAFEFAIPRMGRRADVVIILVGIIFVLEFKIGAKQFDASAIDQAVDYSLDLKNFHLGSHDRVIVPVVVATKALDRAVQLSFLQGPVAEPILSSGAGLARFLDQATKQFPSQAELVPVTWMESEYRPTPTIIEAAQALYRSHRVEEISRSGADDKNLGRTTAALSRIISDSKAGGYKAICFVTGVPGAGKTLAGLNLVRDLPAMLIGLNCEVNGDLHLDVAVRSFRAENLSAFVNAVIAGETKVARSIYEEISQSFPLKLTRDIKEAKAWLRSHAHGTERLGLVAYSGALRLKSEGIDVREKINPANWFLKGKADVRSSFYLEDPATEFDIQGLELDWVAVCWEANFRREQGRWAHYNFRGTDWQKVGSATRRAYMANAYRVLLTRARQGFIIYVPLGDVADRTRHPEIYDEISAYLEECGIEHINGSLTPTSETGI